MKTIAPLLIAVLLALGSTPASAKSKQPRAPKAPSECIAAHAACIRACLNGGLDPLCGVRCRDTFEICKNITIENAPTWRRLLRDQKKRR